MTSSQKKAKFISPNACALCGEDKRSHGLLFHREISEWGGWIAPSNALRLERMKANRVEGQTHTTPYWNQNKPKDD